MLLLLLLMEMIMISYDTDNYDGVGDLVIRADGTYDDDRCDNGVGVELENKLMMTKMFRA